MSDNAENTRPVGRPRMYETPEQMQAAIDAYFGQVKLEMRPPSVCGLALHLGFSTRTGLQNYEGYSPEYHFTIKRAKTRIEQYHEEQLGDNNVAGQIFWLKANAKWRDVQSHELSGAGGKPVPLAIVDFSQLGITYDPKASDTNSVADADGSG